MHPPGLRPVRRFDAKPRAAAANKAQGGKRVMREGKMDLPVLQIFSCQVLPNLRDVPQLLPWTSAMLHSGPFRKLASSCQ